MSTFSIKRADPVDVPILAKIASDAFTNDRNTQVKAIGKAPNDFADGMAQGLSMWVNGTYCELLKAVDNNTGDILGWICWGFRGFEERTARVSPDNKKSAESDKPEGERSDEAAAPSSDANAGQPKGAKTGGERLAELTSTDMERWLGILMPPSTKCMYIIAVSVSPLHQSKGIGSALIRWGTEQADSNGVFCWVHSSEAGARTFVKEGFVEVGRLEVDLDEFAEAPRGDGDGKWGKYVFRYMRRHSREKSQEEKNE